MCSSTLNQIGKKFVKTFYYEQNMIDLHVWETTVRKKEEWFLCFMKNKNYHLILVHDTQKKHFMYSVPVAICTYKIEDKLKKNVF